MRWSPARARRFADNGVADDAVDVIRVPGAWEIAAGRRAPGAPPAGTPRSSRWAASCAATRAITNRSPTAARDGLMRVSLDYGVPVANGVLAVERHEDAEARAGGSHGNKGEEAALAALEMAQPAGASCA